MYLSCQPKKAIAIAPTQPAKGIISRNEESVAVINSKQCNVALDLQDPCPLDLAQRFEWRLEDTTRSKAGFVAGSASERMAPLRFQCSTRSGRNAVSE